MYMYMYMYTVRAYEHCNWYPVKLFFPGVFQNWQTLFGIHLKSEDPVFHITDLETANEQSSDNYQVHVHVHVYVRCT